MQRVRLSEAGVALAALLVSLTVLGVNFYTYRRGSEMVVLQPEQIVFYREPDGQGGPGSLWLAVQVQMVNAARDHGDVVVRASAQVDGRTRRGGAFAFNAMVEPVLTSNVNRALQNCPEAARCLPATGFYVIERPKRLLDVPGGSSRTEFMAFQLEAVNCKSEGDGACLQFSDYPTAMAFLRGQQTADFLFDIEFQFDGTKTMQCALPSDPVGRAAIFDYIDRKGWAMPACQES